MRANRKQIPQNFGTLHTFFTKSNTTNCLDASRHPAKAQKNRTWTKGRFTLPAGAEIIVLDSDDDELASLSTCQKGKRPAEDMDFEVEIIETGSPSANN